MSFLVSCERFYHLISLSPHPLIFILMSRVNFFMDETKYYDVQHYYFGNV
jgi:hypothetical protein